MKPPGTKHLKLKCDEPLSKFAFNFNLHRYNAAGSGYTTAVAAVLSAGGRVEAADSQGWTALHVACAVDSGAAASPDENKTDTNGHTHDDTCGHDDGAGQSGGVGLGRYGSSRRRKPYKSIIEGS